jgi:anti-repressor protein
VRTSFFWLWEESLYLSFYYQLRKGQKTVNAIQLFNFEASDVRVIIDEETKQPWWVAKDICDILGLKNPSKALKCLDEDERSNFKLGRQGETNVINESGVLALILNSRKPQAKRLRKWVTSEVLPSIYRTGSYGVNKEVERQLKDLTESLEALKAKEVPHKAIRGDVEPPQGLYRVAELAEDLDISVAQLYEFMRSCGYVGTRRENWNLPTERSLDKNLMITRKTAYKEQSTHQIVIAEVTRLTAIGCAEIHQRYLKYRSSL